jgi:hypothetical protein
MYVCIKREEGRLILSSCRADEPAISAAFQAFIDALIAKKIIQPTNKWVSPDLNIASKTLGLGYCPRLYGRDATLAAVVQRTGLDQTIKDSRKPLNLMTGFPGTGKTRMLYEAANTIYTRHNGNVAVLAVTFNHLQNAMSQSGLELEMLKISPKLPVILRLIHSYMLPMGCAWGKFVDGALNVIKSLSHEADQFCIADVINIIAKKSNKSKALVLIDETLRWLELAKFKGAPPESTLEQCVQDMVSAVCNACDGAGRGAIFSAFASSFLEKPETRSSRPIETTRLLMLDSDSSDKLIRCALSTSLETLVRNTELTESEIIKILNAVAVGGLPRAAEMLYSALASLSVILRGITISVVISSTHSLLAERYHPEWNLVALALSGVEEWPFDKLLPGMDMTARQAVNRGLLPEPAPNSAGAKISMPPVLLLSALLHGVSKDSNNRNFRKAAKCFASLSLMTPSNVWEEFVVRTFILRSYLSISLRRELNGASAVAAPDASCPGGVDTIPLFEHRRFSRPNKMMEIAPETITCVSAVEGGSSSSSTGNATMPTSAIGKGTELLSVLELFPGCSPRGWVKGCMPDTPVVVAWPLSNTLMKYPLNSPASPLHLIRNPSWMQHVHVSESAVKTGIDMLLFMHRKVEGSVVATGDLIAVGIQCEQSSTTLDCDTVAEAKRSFHLKMEARGWKLEQLVLVVLAYRNPQDIENLQSRVDGNVAVLARGCGIEDWLGPSLLETAQSLQSVRNLQSGPYECLGDLTL